MRDKIRIGHVGTGHAHSEAILMAVRKHPEIFEVVGVSEKHPRNAEASRNRAGYKGLTWMDEDELIHGQKLDAALVETDEWELVPTARKCIDAGLHVHLDKPGGDDYAAFERLLGAARAKHLTLQMAYMLRYNPAVTECMRSARSGELGDIFQIESSMSVDHPVYLRQLLAKFPGGGMYYLGCHLIDLIIQIQGMPLRVVPFLKKTRFDGIDGYDSTLAVLEYPKGTSTVRVSSNEVNGYGRRHFTVCGEKGSVEIRPLENPTIMSVTTQESMDRPFEDHKAIADMDPHPDRYVGMILDFAKAVRGEKQNPYSAEHELNLQKVLLSACGMRTEA